MKLFHSVLFAVALHCLTGIAAFSSDDSDSSSLSTGTLSSADSTSCSSSDSEGLDDRAYYEKAYPHGDAHIFWGKFRSEKSEKELKHLIRLISQMERNGFRTIVNLSADEKNIELAVRDPRTSSILWSSNSTSSGKLLGFDGKRIEALTFQNGAVSRFMHLLLFSSNGESTKNHYVFPKDLHVRYWKERASLTGLDQYIDYLWKKDFDSAMNLSLSESSDDSSDGDSSGGASLSSSSSSQANSKQPSLYIEEHSPVRGLNTQLPASLYQETHPHGDVYLLWGNLDYEWKSEELLKFVKTLRKLDSHGFRTIINMNATTVDVREAVTNPRTAAIIWSSHGDEEGNIFGKDDEEIPTSAFFKGASKNLNLVVMSNCHSEVSKHLYSFRKTTQIHHWHGKTDSKELFYYMNTEWKDDIEKALGVDLAGE